jgi:hypothetical protein
MSSARGNVVLRQRGFGAWTGDYIEYNYKTGKGLTGLGELQAGVFHIGAKEVTRREDGRFDARYAEITTCTNSPGHRHWRMTGHARYKDNDYVEVFDACRGILGRFGLPALLVSDSTRTTASGLCPVTLRGGLLWAVCLQYFDCRRGGPQTGTALRTSTTHLAVWRRQTRGTSRNARGKLKRTRMGSGSAVDRSRHELDVRHGRRALPFRLSMRRILIPRTSHLRGTSTRLREAHDFFETRIAARDAMNLFAEHRETLGAGAVGAAPSRFLCRRGAPARRLAEHRHQRSLARPELRKPDTRRHAQRDAARYERACGLHVFPAIGRTTISRARTRHRVSADENRDALRSCALPDTAHWYSDAEFDRTSAPSATRHRGFKRATGVSPRLPSCR